METDKIRKWIRIIAFLTLISSLAGICFYVLTQSGFIDEPYTKLEVFDFYLGTLIGLAIFLGLWRFKSWGWKLAVVFIPISWIFGIIEIFIHHERGLGIIVAPLVIIDALILNYLFKPDVRQFFNISLTPLLRLEWVVKGLFLLALFLIVNEVFGDLVGVVTVLAVLLGFGTARKRMKKLRSTKDLTSG